MRKIIFLLLLLLPIVLAQNYTIEQLPHRYVFPKYGCISPEIKIISSFPLVGWKAQLVSVIYGAAFKYYQYNTSYYYSQEVDLVYQGQQNSNYVYIIPSRDVSCGDIRVHLIDEHGRRAGTYMLYPTIKDFPYTVEIKFPNSQQLNVSYICYPYENYVCFKDSIRGVNIKYTPDIDNGYIRIEGDIDGFFDPSYSPSDVKFVIDVKITDTNQQYVGSPKYTEPSLSINDYCNVVPSLSSEGLFVYSINCTYPTTEVFRIAKICFSYYYRYYWLFWKPVNSICIYTSGYMTYPNRGYTFISAYPQLIDLGDPNAYVTFHGEVGLWGLGGFPEFAILKLRNTITNETKYFKLYNLVNGPYYDLVMNRKDLLDYVGTGTWEATMYFYNNYCPSHIFNDEDACFEEIKQPGIWGTYTNNIIKVYHTEPSFLSSYGEYNSTHFIFRAFFTYENGTTINNSICKLKFTLKYTDKTEERYGYVENLYLLQTPEGYYEFSFQKNVSKSGTCSYTITCEKTEDDIYYSNTTTGKFGFYPSKIFTETPEMVLGTPYDIIFTPSILYTIVSGILGAAASRFDPYIGAIVFILLLAALTAYGKISILVSLPVAVFTLASMFFFKKLFAPR